MLVPLCLVAPVHSSVTEEPVKTQRPARVVPADAAVHWQGATWRFEALTSVRPSALAELPPRTALILGVISVVPKNKTVAKNIYLCNFTVRDNEGRRWEKAIGSFLPDALSQAYPEECAPDDYDHTYIQPGNRQMVMMTFIVPREVVGQLNLEVTVRSRGESHRLRFAR